MFYDVVRWASIPAFRLYFGLAAEGRDNVPADGAAILAANHVSFLDPAVLGSVCPRRVHFLMKESIWARWGLSWFFRGMEAIPVPSSGRAARDTLRAALDRLDEGRLVGIFPEGGRVEDGAEARLGVALLARRAGVPVIPAGIAGTLESLPPGRALPEPVRVRVRFGEALSYPEVTAGSFRRPRDADDHFARVLMERIRALVAGGEAA